MTSENLLRLIKEPFQDFFNKETMFQEAILQSLKEHSESNVNYRRFLMRSGWDPSKHWSEIPGLPVQAFKSQQLNVETEAGGFYLKSSGTSGALSKVWISSEASKLQKLATFNVLKDFLGADRRKVFVFDIDPQTLSSHSARTAALLAYGRFANEIIYLLEEQGGELRLKENWLALINDSSEVSQPCLVIGFTYVLHTVLKEIDSRPAFHEDSILIHIGGWKKLEDSRVGKVEFKRVITEKLSIKTSNIRDIYGFTELMGASFVECESGFKHVPGFVRARALSQENLTPLLDGTSGILQFFSPLAISYPGASVITDDVGYIISGENACVCGREGQRLEISGRRARAEIRGCGDIIGESLASTKEINSWGQVEVKFPRKRVIQSESLTSELGQLGSMTIALRELPTAVIMSEIEDLRKEWKKQSESSPLSGLKAHGFDYLIDWSRPDNLRQILNDSLKGGLRSLDHFASYQAESKRVRSVPIGNVAQWASGNVPFLSVYSLILSWLTGNPMAIRVSSRDMGILEEILAPLGQMAERSSVARVLRDSVIVLAYSREDAVANRILRSWADCSIIWGGANAVRSLTSFPKKPNGRELVFGPRTSFSLVFESSIDSQRKLAVVAKRIAADAAAFEQLACSSPHSVLLVSDSEELLTSLSDALSNQLTSRVEELTTKNSAAVNLDLELYKRSSLLTARQIFAGSNANVIEIEAPLSLPLPVFGNTLHTFRIRSTNDLTKYLNEFVQTISVAGNAEERLEVSKLVELTSVSRLTQPGQMTNFEIPWDGEDIALAMVRTKTMS